MSFLLAMLLGGCSTPEATPKDAPAAAAKAGKNGGAAASKTKAKSEKGEKGDKAQKTAKGDKADAKAKTERSGKAKGEDAAPIGSTGPAKGVLSFAPAAAPPAAGATAPPAGPHTEAKLTLTFADGSVSTLPLGNVAGTCSEKSPAPIGPAGQQFTPIWAVTCKENSGKTLDLSIAQKEDTLSVLKAVPNPSGGAPEQKVIKRVKLAAGAVVSKS